MEEEIAEPICTWCGRTIPREWIACADAEAEDLRALAVSPAADPICLPHLRELGFASSVPEVRLSTAPL
jgi:hypothetical protein